MATSSTGLGVGESSGMRDHHQKRKLIQCACEPCRKIKGRCDGERPRCSRCREKNILCVYAADQGQTRHDALVAASSNAKKELVKYKDIVEMLFGPADDEDVERIAEELRNDGGRGEQHPTALLLQSCRLFARGLAPQWSPMSQVGQDTMWQEPTGQSQPPHPTAAHSLTWPAQSSPTFQVDAQAPGMNTSWDLSSVPVSVSTFEPLGIDDYEGGVGSVTDRYLGNRLDQQHDRWNSYQPQYEQTPPIAPWYDQTLGSSTSTRLLLPCGPGNAMASMMDMTSNLPAQSINQQGSLASSMQGQFVTDDQAYAHPRQARNQRRAPKR